MTLKQPCCHCTNTSLIFYYVYIPARHQKKKKNHTKTTVQVSRLHNTNENWAWKGVRFLNPNLENHHSRYHYESIYQLPHSYTSHKSLSYYIHSWVMIPGFKTIEFQIPLHCQRNYSAEKSKITMSSILAKGFLYIVSFFFPINAFSISGVI